ncbi:hypothetical protein J8L85_04570 [Maribacter sp. MMG018]|uniref:hypothetical protein n=1 Tax=Maribacter sp. MMG018 TaxID=2822688 RepID=UPI001B375B39|nr:hypothetical protein [Maribacter sp. MMG018]MBQ4913698.1 hypothetical protein [Maribacter sp. MMG018]
MPKIYFFISLVLLLGSCKENASETVAGQTSDWNVMVDKFPKKITLSPKAMELVAEWKEYKELEISFDRLYTVENTEDLILVIEELIEKQKLFEKSVYPKELDIPQVKGRQKVFKTYILKIKGNLAYRQDPQNSIEEMIEAFNIMRDQFNVVVNNTLPQDLISNEEN